MAAETGFLIDGTVYEVPTLDSLTMGERRVMFELSGVTQEDFVQEEDETDDEHDKRVSKLMRHPGFMEALMHVAYQRGNPGVKATKVSLVIDQTQFIDAMSAMAVDEPEEDQVPLELTRTPDEPSPSGPSSSSDLSAPTSAPGGTASTTGLDALADIPVPIGITNSGTSFTFGQEISAK